MVSDIFGDSIIIADGATIDNIDIKRDSDTLVDSDTIAGDTIDDSDITDYIIMTGTWFYIVKV